MTAVSRTAQFAKIHKVLKKYYKPSASIAGRSVLEHLLFACCLEGARHDAAEEAFAALVHTFFDWNEVRVTSISELSEVMACLPDSRSAANRIKRVLHAIFEATFNFDLEEHRKKNLGPTVAWLEKLDGTTPFVVSYGVQSALGGHSIPIDAGTMAALRVLDLVTDKDAAAGVVPGLERAVAKAKGAEFGSLLHELGADFAANPYSTAIRDILLQIDPDCASRMPKRRTPRAERKSPETTGKTEKTEKAAKEHAPVRTDAAGTKSAESSEKSGAKKKRPPAETAPVEPPKRKQQPQQLPANPAVAKKPSSSEGLSKRKPR